MNSKVLKVFYVVLVLDCVVAQQLSKFKCDEYQFAVAHTDPASEHPHLMEIVYDNNGNWTRFCLATLISEDYIMTTAFFAKVFPNIDNVRVRKAKVYGEEYTNDKEFNIIRVITSPELYDGDEILLLQLNESISFQDDSLFRPACLWTETKIPSTLRYTFYGFEYSNISSQPEILFFPRESVKEDVDYFEEKQLLLSHIDDLPLPSSLIKFRSTVQVKHRNRNYIVGLLYIEGSDQWMNILGPGISWIESIIWANQTACGRRKVIHKPLITHGFPTYHGEYPWHVALYKAAGGKRNSNIYICGGSIINFRTILTAAHCVYGEYGVLPANELTILAGIHTLSKYTLDTQTLLVQNILIHPEYNREYLENDIALVKLIGPIKFSNYVQAICFGNDAKYINMTSGIVVGWGKNEHNEPSDVLLQATIPVQSKKECRASNRDFFPIYLNTKNYCAGYDNGTSACSGDSGSGMIFEYKSQWYIRGIVSTATAARGHCDISQFVLFTDASKFYDWILSNIEK